MNTTTDLTISEKITELLKLDNNNDLYCDKINEIINNGFNNYKNSRGYIKSYVLYSLIRFYDIIKLDNLSENLFNIDDEEFNNKIIIKSLYVITSLIKLKNKLYSDFMIFKALSNNLKRNITNDIFKNTNTDFKENDNNNSLRNVMIIIILCDASIKKIFLWIIYFIIGFNLWNCYFISLYPICF